MEQAIVGTVEPSKWLDLGIGGAALLIVLIVVLLIFKQQGDSIKQLCNKLDSVVTSLADNNTKMTEVIVSNDKDQKQLLLLFQQINTDLGDVHARVVRIDSRLFSMDQSKNKGAE